MLRWASWASMLVVTQVLAPAVAPAHEFWLSPSRYRAAAGDTVSVSAFVGTGFRGEIKPYAASRVTRFVLLDAGERDLSKTGRNGDPVMGRFVAGDAGGTVVSYQSNFAEIELEPEAFDRYLAEEGLDYARAAWSRRQEAGPVRERYARCPRTWIQGTVATSGNATGATAGARITRPTGLAYELVPLSDPAAGGTVTLRALFRGRPLAGALVRAWNRPLLDGIRPADAVNRDSVGASARGRTDRNGLVRLRVAEPGEWMVASVHMTPSTDRAAADWESWWASLTFARTTR